MGSKPETPNRLPRAIVNALRCSVCAEPVELTGGSLRCRHGHSFDIARQGYVNLLHARVPVHTADTSEMVSARTQFLSAGHYAALADLVAERAARDAGPGLIVDAGAGTGYYLAAALGRTPAAAGLALDISAKALRKATGAHAHLGGAVWNLWHPWPVRSATAAVILNVFAPRNVAEFARVLAPGGALIVVSPNPEHLGELASVVELLEIGAQKTERLDTTLDAAFTLERREHCVRQLCVPPTDVRALIGMGPNAHHLHRADRAGKLDQLREPVHVTASFAVSTYRHKETP